MTSNTRAHVRRAQLTKDIHYAIGLSKIPPYPADGFQKKGRPIPFPRADENIEAATYYLNRVMRPLHGRIPQFIDLPPYRNAIVRKVLNYLLRANILNIEQAHKHGRNALVAGLYLSFNSNLIISPIGYGSILKRARQQQHHAHLAKLSARPAKVRPRRVLWQADDYKLEELTDPWHFRDEAIAMINCLDECEPLSFAPPGFYPHASIYANATTLGLFRVFSFGTTQRPFVDILYIPMSNQITQMLGQGNDPITPDDVFFPWLIDALTALRTILPGFRIIPDHLSPRTFKHIQNLAGVDPQANLPL